MAESRVNILGVGVDPLTLDRAVDTIAGWIERRDPHYVCVTSVHGVMASQDDPDLRRIHNQAGMVTPDGMPLVWISRWRGHPEVERVYGPDLMLRTFERSQTTGWRHFLFGAGPDTLDRLEANLHARFPRAQIVGRVSPPFRPLDADEDRALTRQIDEVHADIVWVGLSTPVQERWMAGHVRRIDAPALVGVGAAFDFHAGTKRQAPPWLRRAGLEWLFRMGTEPRRLASRYARNNPRFVWLVAREVLGRRRAGWNDVGDHCQ